MKKLVLYFESDDALARLVTVVLSEELGVKVVRCASETEFLKKREDYAEVQQNEIAGFVWGCLKPHKPAPSRLAVMGLDSKLIPSYCSRRDLHFRMKELGLSCPSIFYVHPDLAFNLGKVGMNQYDVIPQVHNLTNLIRQVKGFPFTESDPLPTSPLEVMQEVLF